MIPFNFKLVECLILIQLCKIADSELIDTDIPHLSSFYGFNLIMYHWDTWSLWVNPFTVMVGTDLLHWLSTLCGYTDKYPVSYDIFFFWGFLLTFW